MGARKIAPIFHPDSAPDQPAPPQISGGPLPWWLLGNMGGALLVVGLVDLLLTWYPLSIGNPEWEFATVSATLNGVPVPAMGMVLLLAWAVTRNSRWLVRGLAALCGLLGLAMIGMALLYATDVPLALRAVTDPVLQQGLTRAIAKTTVQGFVYPLVFLWMAVRSWRLSSPPRAGY
jgi:hypothetical protein